MTSFANKFNKVSFGIDTKDFQYIKLGDVLNSIDNGTPNVVHKIDGLFVHRSKLGDSPVIIDAEHKVLINLPAHLAETVREICADNEAVEDIKNGKAGYTIYTYESHGKTCYGIKFADIK